MLMYSELAGRAVCASLLMIYVCYSGEAAWPDASCLSATDHPVRCSKKIAVFTPANVIKASLHCFKSTICKSYNLSDAAILQLGCVKVGGKKTLPSVSCLSSNSLIKSRLNLFSIHLHRYISQITHCTNSADLARIRELKVESISFFCLPQEHTT